MADVIIIGGGAAGMMAAITAARADKEVILIEQNEKLGKKLFITGKGRCNFTNACEIEDLFLAVTSNSKFMYSAFYSFSNQNVLDFFEELGLEYKIERGNRVFPVSDHSSDVIKALEKEMKRLNVKILLNTKVTSLLIENEKCIGADTVSVTNDKGVFKVGKKKQKYFGNSVIVATGGVSYPRTGACRDGYEFAKSVGHSIVEPMPSLVPFELEESCCKDIMGLALKNVTGTVVSKNKKVFQDFGELLFTHFGISGPIVLKASAYIHKYLKEDLDFEIDLKPALDEKTLDERVLKDFQLFQNKQLKNSLDKLMPKGLVPIVIQKSGLDGEKKINEITKEERLNLVRTIKKLSFKISGLRGFDEAIVTKGGIKVKEINPGTMESKQIQGLFFAGEVLDLDALTGGYNLQIAWSTGYLAGLNA